MGAVTLVGVMPLASTSGGELAGINWLFITSGAGWLGGLISPGGVVGAGRAADAAMLSWCIAGTKACEGL